MTSKQKKQILNRTLQRAEASMKNNGEKSKWNMLVMGIVRPPKAIYSSTKLGNPVFVMNQRIYFRQDYSIPHQAPPKIIDLTVYTQNTLQPYIIIYLHGNTSNRLQGVNLLKYAPSQFAVACFDFLGCGNNNLEQTISLGYRQAEQVKTVCTFLRSSGYKIIIWGRSMGAVTALLYGKADIIVSDSAFSTFKGMCKDVVKTYSPKIVPKFCISCIFPCVFHKLRTDVKSKAKYNVQKLNVLNAVKKIDPNCILILIAGDKDQLISIKNSQQLWQVFPGKNKHIQIFEGTHNSVRPKKVMEKIMDMMRLQTLKLQQEHFQISQIHNSGKQKQIEQQQKQIEQQQKQIEQQQIPVKQKQCNKQKQSSKQKQAEQIKKVQDTNQQLSDTKAPRFLFKLQLVHPST